MEARVGPTLSADEEIKAVRRRSVLSECAVNSPSPDKTLRGSLLKLYDGMSAEEDFFLCVSI